MNAKVRQQPQEGVQCADACVYVHEGSNSGRHCALELYTLVEGSRRAAAEAVKHRLLQSALSRDKVSPGLAVACVEETLTLAQRLLLFLHRRNSERSDK